MPWCGAEAKMSRLTGKISQCNFISVPLVGSGARTEVLGFDKEEGEC
jgi:hypothetical protein